ncbi:HTH-type transcriptional regulator ImmR [Streptococcus constellatus]|uniref:HTH-type transcriptional regulator ImmR n=1 Tax=Streptococcus constellatus TaxID=76860 RepID=A0A564TC27_STRCV|nr:helix-turn-helix transcriptional regulator [Streptococcus constellatus]VUW93975.1 HTH-type transcriptional regulator ImmR [Streptococcus gordonii]VUX04990.1 HTH-type transcriptional regulator ImmR [Streptococcus constellatus]
MEVGKQIQRYRKEKNLSQDELADKIFVSRQSISNWERDVTYPDIQNLLLLSQVFDISLDTLIKGDIQTMKEIIHQTDYKQYVTDSKLFVIFLLLSITVTIPLILYLEWYGAAFSFLIWIISMFYAHKIDRFKNKHNLRTYRELVAYDEGKSLSDIEQIREDAKAPYQKILIVLAFSGATVIIALLITSICLWLFPIK